VRRFFLTFIAALGLVATVSHAPPVTGSLVAPSFAQETAPAERPELNAETGVDNGAPGTVETRRTTWFVDPLWIGLAVGALILIVVLFAAGSRTAGTTTIVKD
jgi:hypothetical protein